MGFFPWFGVLKILYGMGIKGWKFLTLQDPTEHRIPWEGFVGFCHGPGGEKGALGTFQQHFLKCENKVDPLEKLEIFQSAALAPCAQPSSSHCTSATIVHRNDTKTDF